MKTLGIILLSVLFFSAKAQNTGEPDWYLNNNKVDACLIRHLNSENIESISVDKSTQNGAVYISTKENVKFVTLDEIVEKYTDLGKIDSSMLFQIENDMVYDISDFVVDDSYFIYVEVKDISQVKYIDENCKALKLVVLSLETTERKPQIRIRGNEALGDLGN